MHSQHVALLVKILFHQRIAFVLRYVHVLEDLVEALVDLFDRQLEDEVLDVLHVVVVALVGREGSGAVGIVSVPVASFGGAREQRVQEAARLGAIVL